MLSIKVKPHPVPIAVFAVFLTLKLTGTTTVADWPWWWVASPLWIPLAVALLLALSFVVVPFIFFGVLAVIVGLLEWADKMISNLIRK